MQRSRPTHLATRKPQWDCSHGWSCRLREEPHRQPYFFLFLLCHRFVDPLSKQSFIQDTWWSIPRVKKAVRLQFAWITMWLLIFFGSCAGWWVVSFLCQSIWYLPFASSYYFWLICEHWKTVCFRKGICQDLGSEEVDVLRVSYIDLVLRCNTRNEESPIMKNEGGIATCNSQLF